MHMRFTHGFQARLLIVIRTTYFSPCQASLGDSNTQYANIMFCNHSAACCAATSISYILSITLGIYQLEDREGQQQKILHSEDHFPPKFVGRVLHAVSSKCPNGKSSIENCCVLANLLALFIAKIRRERS